MYLSISYSQIIHQPIWFYISLALFLVILLFLFYMVKSNFIFKLKDAELNRNQLHEFRTRLNSLNEIIEKNTQSEKTDPNTIRKKPSRDIKFYSLIAHDLRSPTAALITTAEFLLEGFESMSDRKKKLMLNVIFDSSNQLLNLLDNLLSWTTMQESNLSISPEKFDLNDVQDEIIGFLKLTAEKKKVIINPKVPKGTYVEADRKMITAVLRNLLSNAIKFTEFLNEIELVMLNADDNVNTPVDLTKYMVIRVIDTGVGIPEEDQPKLFSEESTFSQEGTSGEKGTGLGLVICKEFTEKNGGEIWFNSKPGKGSEFFVSIPKAN